MEDTTTPQGTVIRRVRADSPDVLEALLTGAGEHLLPVLDVGRTAGGDLLLVQPSVAARLPDLLEVAGWPTPGEAVTVLAPLALALQRLHRAGVALGGARAEEVVLDPDGCPAWNPLGPVLLRRAGPVAFTAAAEADRAGFARLASALTARAGVPVRAEALDPDALVAALFDLAEPLAVRLVPEVETRTSAIPARLLPTAADASDGPSTGLVPAVSRSLRGVRRRVWIAAGGVAVALLAAVVALPAAGSADAGGTEVAPRTTAPSVRRTAAPQTPVVPRAASGTTALPRLLAARASCLAAGGASCLDRVDAPGSPVRTADGRAIESGTAPTLPTGRPTVLSDGGGTVVARVGRAVVVATRQQDGWRLRDVVAEPPG